MELRFRNIFTKVSQIMTIIKNIVYYILLVFSVIILVGFMIDKYSVGTGNIYGYKPIIIQTGSMEPAIKKQALIVGKTVEDLNSLKKNDIITYKIHEEGREKLITHRIVEINHNTKLLQTKGDANRSKDFFKDKDGLEFKNVVYQVDFIFNNISPFLIIITKSPRAVFSLVVVILGTVGLWKVLNYYYFDKKFKFQFKKGGESK